MTERIDVLSPTTIGEGKISVTLDPRTVLLTERPITVNFNFARADANGGVTLPLIIEVVPVSDPEKTGYQKSTFRSTRPSSYTFTVEGAGTYLVLIRESAHNKWVGQLRVIVGGDEFAAIKVSERL